MRNDAEFQLANHEYKLELTRFSMVTSMVAESFYQESCLKPVALGELLYADQSHSYSKGRRVCNISNCHDGYVVHQICHDKQVLRMYHTKEYLSEAHQPAAETVAQRSTIENAKMFVIQPAPDATIIEWIKKQKKDLKSQGFGGRTNHGDQATTAGSD